MITASLEHSENAAAIAGESSAEPFDERYIDGITHALLLGGGHVETPEAKLMVKARSHKKGVNVNIVNDFQASIRNQRNYFIEAFRD